MNNNIITYDLLIWIGLLITIISQILVSASYSRFKKKLNNKDITGFDAARKILDKNDLKDIMILETKGNLTDHYDPTRKVIRLSTDIYHGSSIASVAVAAHECGHAIQDKENYTFMRIRSTLVPFVNFVTYLGYFSLIISLIAGITGYLIVGILILLATLLFQIVTLPVEFDASNRAQKQLISLQLVDKEEQNGVHNMLRAAAMTYVASVISTLLNLLRLIIMFNDRDN